MTVNISNERSEAVWNECKNGEGEWGETLNKFSPHGRVRLARFTREELRKRLFCSLRVRGKGEFRRYFPGTHIDMFAVAFLYMWLQVAV